MKRVAIIAAIAISAVIAAVWLTQPKEAPPKAKIQKRSADAPTSTKTDPTEVFKRAFWRSPTAADKILHAERREWADGNGIKKWQWFIQLEPSPELLKYLRADNAFGLTPAPGEIPKSDAPDWFTFKAEDVEALVSSGGNLRLHFSKSGNTLYATDSGGGFHAGAAEINGRISAPVSTGRLPQSPPPTSKQ